MSQIIIPTARVTSPVRDGGDTPFPEGEWCGTILKVEVQGFPPWASEEDNGYANEDGESLNIHFAPNTPLNGQDDIGERRHFVPMVVRDGNETTITIDVEAKNSSKKLQAGTSLLANLGKALGETEEIEGENGRSMTAVTEDFEENLKAGMFDGTSVGFIISHNNWTFKGKSGTKAVTEEFFQAV